MDGGSLVKNQKTKLATNQPSEQTDEVDSLDAFLEHSRAVQENPSMAGELGEAIVQLKIDRPKKNHYFRVLPPPEKGYFQLAMIDGSKLSGVPKNWYVVEFSIVSALEEYAKGIKKYALVPTIDRDGNIRVWPHSLAAEGQAESWFNSRERVIRTALESWIRFEANSHESRYEIIPAGDQTLIPAWPANLDYVALIKKAVGEYRVTRLDHPVVKSIRGESLVSLEK